MPSSVVLMSVETSHPPRISTSTCPMADCGGRLIKLWNAQQVWYFARSLNHLSKRLIILVSVARSNLWQCLSQPYVLPLSIFVEQTFVLTPQLKTRDTARQLQHPLLAPFSLPPLSASTAIGWSEAHYSGCILARRHLPRTMKG